MTQKSQKYKPTPIITSPEGDRIKITQGAKAAFTAAIQAASSKDLSDIQKRLYQRYIDKTNEGFGSDKSKFGYAYVGFETLAKELGCSVSTVKENAAALETGVMKGRKDRKSPPNVIPERYRIKVKRKGAKGQGGTRNANHVWLPLWIQFAAVDKGPAQFTSEGLLSLAWLEERIYGFDTSEAENEAGVLPVIYEWNKGAFDAAVDMHDFDEYELDDELDIFIKHHSGERKLDWSPDWLAWIKTPEVHERQLARVRQRVASPDDPDQPEDYF